MPNMQGVDDDNEGSERDIAEEKVFYVEGLCIILIKLLQQLLMFMLQMTFTKTSYIMKENNVTRVVKHKKN